MKKGKRGKEEKMGKKKGKREKKKGEKERGGGKPHRKISSVFPRVQVFVYLSKPQT